MPWRSPNRPRSDQCVWRASRPIVDSKRWRSAGVPALPALGLLGLHPEGQLPGTDSNRRSRGQEQTRGRGQKDSGQCFEQPARGDQIRGVAPLDDRGVRWAQHLERLGAAARVGQERSESGRRPQLEHPCALRAGHVQRGTQLPLRFVQVRGGLSEKQVAAHAVQFRQPEPLTVRSGEIEGFANGRQPISDAARSAAVLGVQG